MMMFIAFITGIFIGMSIASFKRIFNGKTLDEIPSCANKIDDQQFNACLKIEEDNIKARLFRAVLSKKIPGFIKTKGVQGYYEDLGNNIVVTCEPLEGYGKLNEPLFMLENVAVRSLYDTDASRLDACLNAAKLSDVVFNFTGNYAKIVGTDSVVVFNKNTTLDKLKIELDLDN